MPGCKNTRLNCRSRKELRLLFGKQVFYVPSSMEHTHNVNATGKRHIEDEVGSKARDRSAAHAFEAGDAGVVRVPESGCLASLAQVRSTASK